MASRTFFAFLLLLAGAVVGPAQSRFPYQMPTVNDGQIAFVYAGEIWAVDRRGGEARLLIPTPATEKVGPVFSPDGSQLAFSMNVGGNLDVYVVPAAGGEPRRLTYHPGPNLVVGWSPDGRNLLFRSVGVLSGTAQLYTIPAQGGFEQPVPLPTASEASYSPDGDRLAYTPVADPTRAWRNYRGGMTSPVWVARLSDSLAQPLPAANSNDRSPMWVGDKIYFLSDRTETANLFAYDTLTKKTEQLTRFEKYDIRSASFGGRGDNAAIAFVQDGAIHLFQLKSKQDQVVPITIGRAEWAELKPRTVAPPRWVRSFNISPDGSQAIFEARGEVLTVGANGEARNLTNTPGVAERTPGFSPDGKWVAYFSDLSGEYQLHLRPVGGGEVKKIAVEPQPSYYSEPEWSPDSQKLAFYDKRLNLWYVDIDKGMAVKVDTSLRASQMPAPAWSPDSRWLAYTRCQPNFLRVLHLYSLDAKKSYAVSDGRLDADSPVFDKSGKYLYFTSSANAGPRSVFGMSSFTFRTLVTRSINAAVLDKDTPSPLISAPGNQAASGAEEAAGIDVEGIGQRIVRLTAPARDYAGIFAGKPGILFALEVGIQSPNVLHRLDVANRKVERFVEGVGGAVVSGDGSKLLYAGGGNYSLVATDAPAKAGEGRLDLAKAAIQVGPRDEWRQMYNEAWRLMRDYFYSDGFHGQNLAALKEHYAAYLPNVVTRSDLNSVFREMFSHMTISHMQIGGGDTAAAGQANVGLLGADFDVHQGRYRITRVYAGDNSEAPLSAPLAQPGVHVRAGDYLIAVDGQEITAAENLFKYFLGKAGRPAQVKVASRPDGAEARTYTVVPLPDDRTLRAYNWVEENRRKVAEMSGGRLGYVYLPDTGGTGYNMFNRDFYAQFDKEGMIVDERNNSGGAPADYFIDMLSRRPLSAYTFREGVDMNFPVAALQGPRVMIINENAGSGGDTLPWMFRAAGVGTLVGKRTWGGGIGGFVPLPPFLDGGTMLAPNRAFYNPKTGAWDIENHGVAPDVEVELDPKAVREGRDPQLERAVQIALENLKKSPPAVVKRPKKAIYK